MQTARQPGIDGRSHGHRTPLAAFDGLSEERLRSILEAGRAERAPEHANHWLLCASCRRRITREKDRIDYLGLKEHTRTNPHGITFRFGSFSAASGCEITGEPIAAFTWFAGFYWRLALCGGCSIHLGWQFESPRMRFYGLVLDRLTIADHSSDGNP